MFKVKCNLKINACTSRQSCLHTPFPTPSHTRSDVGYCYCHGISRVSESFPGMPHPSTLPYVCCSCKLLAGPDAYPMHFTRYSLQWHLRNFKTKCSRLLLNDLSCYRCQEYKLILSTTCKYI